jgi:hypothetical protein
MGIQVKEIRQNEIYVEGKVMKMSIWLKQGAVYKVEISQLVTDAEYSPLSYMEDYESDIIEFRRFVNYQIHKD